MTNLTTDQRRVARLFAYGHRLADIVAHSGLSAPTVHGYLADLRLYYGLALDASDSRLREKLLADERLMNDQPRQYKIEMIKTFRPDLLGERSGIRKKAT